jgi:hypothetical protein
MKNSIAILCVFICLCCSVSFAQNLRAKRRPGKRKDGDPTKLFKALQVLYPLKFFNPTLLKENYDWRAPGVYDSNFAAESERTREYVQIGRAQDQEDVWLYENWFYGIKNGIILESGALDGLLFSNSYMFETFANWTAIHVGKSCRFT